MHQRPPAGGLFHRHPSVAAGEGARLTAGGRRLHFRGQRMAARRRLASRGTAGRRGLCLRRPARSRRSVHLSGRHHPCRMWRWHGVWRSDRRLTSDRLRPARRCDRLRRCRRHGLRSCRERADWRTRRRGLCGRAHRLGRRQRRGYGACRLARSRGCRRSGSSTAAGRGRRLGRLDTRRRRRHRFAAAGSYRPRCPPARGRGSGRLACFRNEPGWASRRRTGGAFSHQTRRPTGRIERRGRRRHAGSAGARPRDSCRCGPHLDRSATQHRRGRHRVLRYREHVAAHALPADERLAVDGGEPAGSALVDIARWRRGRPLVVPYRIGPVVHGPAPM